MNCSEASESRSSGLAVAGLFAGIGGIELGLGRAGHHARLLCEVEDAAAAVLGERFPDVTLVRDVRDLETLPQVDLVAGGFPCQDLSQAGKTAGIEGANSGLVGHVFRLLESMARPPQWLLLENVPFMLQLDGGRAMRFLTDTLHHLGWQWAYRVVDTRSFGLPQRRLRVLLLASQTDDPRRVLFADDAGGPSTPAVGETACGFYWTEGLRGLGWAVDAVPTLKGGSSIGIPSPPAIWFPSTGLIGTPDIRDAERLQGFQAGWTDTSEAAAKKGRRWKLVGNAVTVPVFEWVGQRLTEPGFYDGSSDRALPASAGWPSAAWGDEGVARDAAAVSPWPVTRPYSSLASFLEHPIRPLSARATSGFLRRARAGTLRMDATFLAAVDRHLHTVIQSDQTLLPV